MQPTQLLTVQEMCEEWRCGAEDLRTWIRKGMPCYKTKAEKYGNVYQFDLKACQRWWRTTGDGEK